MALYHLEGLPSGLWTNQRVVLNPCGSPARYYMLKAQYSTATLGSICTHDHQNLIWKVIWGSFWPFFGKEGRPWTLPWAFKWLTCLSHGFLDFRDHSLDHTPGFSTSPKAFSVNFLVFSAFFKFFVTTWPGPTNPT